MRLQGRRRSDLELGHQTYEPTAQRTATSHHTRTTSQAHHRAVTLALLLSGRPSAQERWRHALRGRLQSAQRAHRGGLLYAPKSRRSAVKSTRRQVLLVARHEGSILVSSPGRTLQTVHSIPDTRRAHAIPPHAYGPENGIGSIRTIRRPHDRRIKIHQHIGVHRRPPDILENRRRTLEHTDKNLQNPAELQHDPRREEMHSIRTFGLLLGTRGRRTRHPYRSQQNQGHPRHAFTGHTEKDDERTRSPLLLPQVRTRILQDRGPAQG